MSGIEREAPSAAVAGRREVQARQGGGVEEVGVVEEEEEEG